jgi:hypothetical protein
MPRYGFDVLNSLEPRQRKLWRQLQGAAATAFQGALSHEEKLEDPRHRADSAYHRDMAMMYDQTFKILRKLSEDEFGIELDV